MNATKKRNALKTMTDTLTPGWHPLPDIGAYLGVHTNTFYRLIRDGEISAIRIHRQYRIHTSDLTEYIQNHMTGKEKTSE